MKRCKYCGIDKAHSEFYSHPGTKDKLQRFCKACAKPLRDKYRELNWSGELATQRKYYAKYRVEHPDRVKKYQQRYRDKSKEKIAARSKDWYERDKVRPDSTRAKWVADNIERVREAKIRNKAKRRGASGHHTLEEWRQLKAHHDHTCLRCRRVEPEIKLTRDHVIPLTKGGTDDISNIQPLCLPCNQNKLAKHIDYRPQWPHPIPSSSAGSINTICSSLVESYQRTPPASGNRATAT